MASGSDHPGAARDAGGRRGVGWVPVALAGFGLALGALAGTLLAGGFRFDWYVHPPLRTLAWTAFFAWVARIAAAAALAAAPLGAVLAARRHARAAGATDPHGRKPVPLDVHVLRVTVLMPAALALVGVGVALGVRVALGADAVAAAALAPGLAAAGAVAAAAAYAAGRRSTAQGLVAGRIVPSEPGKNLVARTMLASASAPRRVLAVVLVVTLVSGYGLTLIQTNVDVADVLPRGDYNTQAAHNLTDRFKSAFTQQVTFQLRVNPDAHAGDEAKRLPYRVTDAAPGNITDEVYVRAIDELLDFVKSYVPPGADHAPFEHAIALPGFYRLINWTVAGGTDAPDASYSLPPADTPDGSARYAMVHDGVWRMIPESAEAVVSPDYAQTAVLVMVDPHESLSSREIGQAAFAARDAYVAWAESDPDAYKVFTGDNAPKFTVDLPLANAHESAVTERDFSRLLPLVGLYIAFVLWLAFRDVKHLVVAFSSLGLSVVWTFGAMGWLGIPMNALNLAVVPLIMGVGIDYGIHVMNEYQHNRARGRTHEEAFRRTGVRTGIALLVATVTSVSGLLVMVASPSLMVAELGLLAALALTAIYVLMVTFVPALTTLLDPRVRDRSYKPSRRMAWVAGRVARRRATVAVVLLIFAGAAVASSQNLHTEPFGDFPQNWQPDDPVRREHEEAGKGFYATDEPDVKANILVFEGDIVDPQAHAYMDAIEASLKEQDRVISDTLRTLPFITRTYLTVRDGVPGAAQYLLLTGLAEEGGMKQAEPYPETREELEAVMREAQQTPLAEFSSLFYDYPENTMATMTFSARAASWDDAAEVWDQVWAAIHENEELRPEGMRVAFVGNTATNYLFVAKEVPWIGYMSAVVSVGVIALVAAVTRDRKAAVVVGTHNLLTGILWLGVLPLLGIGLAITLTVPLVFIFAMGSDYSLHLALACREEEDTPRVFATTGKAILYSFLTTFGAFLLFTQVSNLAVQRTMTATSVAIAIIFAATVLLIPSFYPGRAREAPGKAYRADAVALLPQKR